MTLSRYKYASYTGKEYVYNYKVFPLLATYFIRLKKPQIDRLATRGCSAV